MQGVTITDDESIAVASADNPMTWRAQRLDTMLNAARTKQGSACSGREQAVSTSVRALVCTDYTTTYRLLLDCRGK
jgi:hypothetical protein